MAKVALVLRFCAILLLITTSNGNVPATNSCSFYCFLQSRPNEQIDATLYKHFACTHMVYGFASLAPTLELETPSSYDLQDSAFIGNFEKLQVLKQTSKYPKKLLLGIHVTGRFDFLSNPATRRRVAKAAVQMAKTNSLDGFFWYLEADSIWNADLVNFFKTLQAEIQKNNDKMDVVLALSSRRIARAMHVLDDLEPLLNAVYLIASLVPSSEDPSMAIAVDPLFGSADVPIEDSISDNAELLAKHGFPRRKIIVGLSGWSFSFKAKSKDDKIHHGSPIKGHGPPGPLTRRNDGRLAFHEICKLATDSNLQRDNTAQVTHFKADTTWYSVTQPDFQLKSKLTWIGENEFGGVGLSSIAADDHYDICGLGAFPLHTFIERNLQCNVYKAKRGTNPCTRLCTWRPSNDTVLDFNNFAPNWCSHLVLSTLEMDGHTGAVKSNDHILETVENYAAWKVKEKPLLLFSLGDGQGNDVWRMALSVPHKRAALINSLKRLLYTLDIDGIVITWTQPGPENALDTKFLDLFVGDFRQRFSDRVLILATTPQSAFSKRYNVKELTNHLDYVLVQGYRFHSYKNFFTGHHSPLFMNSEILMDSKNTIEGLANDWISRGVNRSKLIIEYSAEGMMMFFAAFRNGIENVIGSQANAVNAVFRAKTNGLVSQSDICNVMKSNGSKLRRVDELGIPYLSKDDEFYAFDDKLSMQIKAVWTSLRNFGGLGLYALDADNAQGLCPINEPFPLLKSLVKAQVCDSCLSDSTLSSKSKSQCRANFQISCSYRIPSNDDLQPLYPDQIPFKDCTEIVVEEAQLTAQGEIEYSQPNSTDILDALLNATDSRANKKLVLSMRCNMNETAFEKLLTDVPLLIKRLFNHLDERNFDGIELRCDNVLSPNTKKAYNELLTGLIHQFTDEQRDTNQCPKTLSIRVPAWNINLNNFYNIATLNTLHHVVLEPFQAMTNTTQLISPLFAVETADHSHQAIDSTLDLWLSDGLHRQVILLHIPTYAIVQGLTHRNDLLAEIESAVKGHPFKLISQSSLCSKLAQPGIRQRMHYDSVAAFATSPQPEWLSFETSETVTYKVKYALRERLGGIGFMALNEDDFNNACKQGHFPLLKAAINNQCVHHV